MASPKKHCRRYGTVCASDTQRVLWKYALLSVCCLCRRRACSSTPLRWTLNLLAVGALPATTGFHDVGPSSVLPASIVGSSEEDLPRISGGSLEDLPTMDAASRNDRGDEEEAGLCKACTQCKEDYASTEVCCGRPRRATRQGAAEVCCLPAKTSADSVLVAVRSAPTGSRAQCWPAAILPGAFLGGGRVKLANMLGQQCCMAATGGAR